MANALLKKVSKKETSSSGSRTVKTAATVTDNIKKAVDEIIAHKAHIAKLTQSLGDYEIEVRSHVNPQYEKLGRTGNFTKSLTVEGNSGSLTYTKVDKFSVPKDESTQSQIRELIGEEKFNEFFETVNTVAIKKDVLNNDKLINKLVAVCEKAGLDVSEIFDREEHLVAKSDLDRKQFSLDEKAFEIFKTLVRQNEAGLR